jgi:predicted RNA-binding Zn-ribbon protein involved in translation (DUF1610 family)
MRFYANWVRRPTGSVHTNLSRRIRQFGLDTSHFVGVRCNAGTKARNRRQWHEILLKRGNGTREKGRILRRALIESGRPYKCAKCGQGPVWDGKPLTLQVEHKNTELDDDRPENLEFLCPNCHTQTETHSKIRSSGRKCSSCGKRLKCASNKSGVCWTCGRGKPK